MKTFFNLVSLVLLIGYSLNAPAQPQQIYSSYWSGSHEIFTATDLNTGITTDLDTINGVSTLSIGGHTYDPDGQIYIRQTNLGTTLIDARNGSLLNSFPAGGALQGIEYDPVSQQLYGSYYSGAHQIFASMDLGTGIVRDIDSLSGVNGVGVGESAIDVINRQYFVLTNLGIVQADLISGNIQNVFPNQQGLKGMEFDAASNRIYGSYWNGSNEVFAYLDVGTGSISNVSVLPGVQTLGAGEGALDSGSGTYYTLTNLGITVIDLQTGSILNTITPTVPLKGYEIPYCSGSATPELIAISQSTICEGDSAELIIASGYANYQWSNGAASTSIKVTDSSDYFVRYTDLNGCWVQTNPVSVEVVDCAGFVDSASFVIDTCMLDTIPIISAYIDNIVIVNDTVFLDWIFVTGTNDTLTASATYAFNENGVYIIGITVNCNGKRNSSLSFFDIISIDHLIASSSGPSLQESRIRVYPNPVESDLVISSNKKLSKINIELWSLQGALVKKQAFNETERIQLDLGWLPAGMYTLRVTESLQTQSFIIMKR